MCGETPLRVSFVRLRIALVPRLNAGGSPSVNTPIKDAFAMPPPIQVIARSFISNASGCIKQQIGLAGVSTKKKKDLARKTESKMEDVNR